MCPALMLLKLWLFWKPSGRPVEELRQVAWKVAFDAIDPQGRENTQGMKNTITPHPIECKGLGWICGWQESDAIKCV